MIREVLVELAYRIGSFFFEAGANLKHGGAKERSGPEPPLFIQRLVAASDARTKLREEHGCSKCGGDGTVLLLGDNFVICSTCQGIGIDPAWLYQGKAAYDDGWRKIH